MRNYLLRIRSAFHRSMSKQTPTPRPAMLSNEEWKQKLAPEEYRVLRESGTEAPFTNRYYLTDASGAYHCAGCGAQLFDSQEKFHSSCGWPAFSSNTVGGIEETKDTSHFMVRTEVKCSPLARIDAFKRSLLAAGIPCTVRTPKGRDIMAACGQLKGTLLEGITS